MTFKEFIDKKLSGEDISKIKSLDVSVKLNLEEHQTISL